MSAVAISTPGMASGRKASASIARRPGARPLMLIQAVTSESAATVVEATTATMVELSVAASMKGLAKNSRWLASVAILAAATESGAWNGIRLVQSRIKSGAATAQRK